MSDDHKRAGVPWQRRQSKDQNGNEICAPFSVSPYLSNRLRRAFPGAWVYMDLDGKWKGIFRSGTEWDFEALPSVSIKLTNDLRQAYPAGVVVYHPARGYVAVFQPDVTFGAQIREAQAGINRMVKLKRAGTFDDLPRENPI